MPSVALPLTRPDSLASLTTPRTSAPCGTAVMPSITSGFAMAPLTRSSTCLVFDRRWRRTDTASDVPAGTVTVRNAGGGGSTGFGGAAGSGAAGGAAEAEVAGDDGAGIAGAADLCGAVA